MKSLLCSSVLAFVMASPAFAQDGDPARFEKGAMLLTATQMDNVRAGALVNVNATALNNVSANVPVNAQVVALSSGVAQTASQTARIGNPVFRNFTAQQ